MEVGSQTRTAAIVGQVESLPVRTNVVYPEGGLSVLEEKILDMCGIEPMMDDVSGSSKKSVN